MTATADPVLYLTHRVPYPPDKGDRIRNWHLLRQLAVEAPVWLGCLADEPVPPESVDKLRAVCQRLAVVPVGRYFRWLRAGWSLLTGKSLSEGLFATSGLRAVLRQWTTRTRFRAAVVSASSLVPYLREPALADTPRFVDLVDVDSQKWMDFAAVSSPPWSRVYRIEGVRVRRLEADLPRWTQAVSVVSRAEAAIYESFAGPGTATVATNGVDLDYFYPAEPARNLICVFVGAMDYRPNVDGAVWFVREVWPQVRARHPAAEFRIVGRKPDPRVMGLAAAPGVVVTGSVPDVRPHLAAAAVVVAPLRLARGVQNKVLEAMAMARPVVATPAALGGLDVVSGRDVWRADTAEAFAAAVADLLANPDRGRELGQAARRFVDTHHDWQRCLEPFVRHIISARSVPPPHDR